MAPSKGQAKPSPKATKEASKSKDKVFKSSSSSSKTKAKRPPPQEMKNKARTAPENLKKTKKREYTEQELNLPDLNTITPVGVTKPRGKKKGKVFVDDQESMATILAMVNAEKEGQIESKVMKARQFEEIREARRKEIETKQEQKKANFENLKNDIRYKKKKSTKAGDTSDKTGTKTSITPTTPKKDSEDSTSPKKQKRKSVSFS